MTKYKQDGTEFTSTEILHNAAPDLLAACKRTLAALGPEQYPILASDRSTVIEMPGYMVELQQAIAKAEGKD